MFQIQILPQRPSSLQVSVLPQQQWGTRRRAAEQRERTDTDPTTNGDMTPCRRARLSLNLIEGGEQREDSREESKKDDDDTFPINFQRRQFHRKRPEDFLRNSWNDALNGGGPQPDEILLQAPQQQKSTALPNGVATAKIIGMSSRASEEEKSPPRRQCCMAPPPAEPVLERVRPLGSAPSPRLVPLSGSLSCANLARITAPLPSLMANSASSNALDQLQSTEPTQLFDHLYLGSQKDALDAELLTRRGISRVINLSENCPRCELLPDDPGHFLRIPVNDTYAARLLPYFESAFHFIEEARKAGERVLMHCLAGISRSPTMAIAYVMRAKGIGNEEAYHFVKVAPPFGLPATPSTTSFLFQSRRPTISPNFNFLGQLWEYERQLRHQHILPPAPSTPEEGGGQQSVPSNEPAATPEKGDTALSTPPVVVNANGKRPMLTREAMEGEQKTPPGGGGPSPQPVPRPRQLLGPLHSRLSCPPSLTDGPSRLCANSPSTDIPSPSTEFSRLDISLANPCFGLSDSIRQQHMRKPAITAIGTRRKPPSLPPLFSTASMALENPVFGASADWKHSGGKIGLGESVSCGSSSSSGVSSASASLCSTESVCSSMNDSFSSIEEFGASMMMMTPPPPAFSTRNCLADTDGDELVRLGPTGGHPMGRINKKEEEEEREFKPNMHSPSNGYGGGAAAHGSETKWIEHQKRAFLRRALWEKKMSSSSRKCILENPHQQQQVRMRHPQLAYTTAIPQACRPCMPAANFLKTFFNSSIPRQHHHHHQRFESPHSGGGEKRKAAAPALTTTPSSSSSTSQSPSNSLRPKLLRTPCCIDRRLLAAFGRGKRNHATTSAQFRQSLPTIGDDRRREEEEEEREEGVEENLGTAEEQQERAVKTAFGHQKLEQLEQPFIEPDRSSISSASSLEIAVQ